MAQTVKMILTTKKSMLQCLKLNGDDLEQLMETVCMFFRKVLHYLCSEIYKYVKIFVNDPL